MRALLELLCAVVGHRTPPGVRKSMSIAYCCDRCHHVVNGDFVPARRRA